MTYNQYYMQDLDTQINSLYLDQITDTIKYGENAVYFWFPGSGMTTVINDIFTDKKLLRRKLGNLYSNLKIYLFQGHVTLSKTFEGLVYEAGFKSFEDLKTSTLKELNRGNELTFVIYRIDDYPTNERYAILKAFQKLTAINPRRVHILFHSINKPYFIDLLKKNAEFTILANRMHIMPIIKGDVLSKYIKEKSNQYLYPLNPVEEAKIAKIYGGIMQFTKEYLRSHGDITNLKLKIKLIWDSLPTQYKQILEKTIIQEVNKENEDAFLDLIKFGVMDIDVFKVHKEILNIDSKKLLLNILSKNESNLYNYFLKNKGKLISKETVAEILRPDDSDNFSLWAIDKAISRLRSKMENSAMDPEILETIKGKGYIWH